MAMGTVIKKTLKDGETILVDGNTILCFDSSVTVDVRPVGGFAAICCGGAGIFNTELTGALLFIFVYVCLFVCLFVCFVIMRCFVFVTLSVRVGSLFV